MPELTPEEQEILKKLKRDDAAREAIPDSEKTPVAQPDKYAFPIGVGDDGKPLPDPPAKGAAKEDLSAKLEETTRRIAEGFRTATDRIRELGNEMQQRAQQNPTKSGERSTKTAPDDDPISALADALAGKAPAAGAMAPIVGAVRQLEQTLEQLGRVVGAAATPEGRGAIAEEVTHIREAMREGDTPEPTAQQRDAVHEGLTTLWRTLSEIGSKGAAAREPGSKSHLSVVPDAAVPQGEVSTAPDVPTADGAATEADAIATLLHELETGAATPEEVEERIAALRAQHQPPSGGEPTGD